MSFTLEARAKINLSLRVLAKRADGYHGVRTLMLPIGLADSLKFESLDTPQIEITCSDPSLPTDQRNLVRKAAELLQSRHAKNKGARIHLQKVTPMGAGLGGGSSDGSTTLVGLNKLWKLNLPEKDLETLSAEFGSDTAFFVRSQPALSEGRGEILTPVEFPITLPIFLMNFGFPSATGWAYKNLRMKNEGRRMKPESGKNKKMAEKIHASLKSFNLKDEPFFQNDLEEPVFRKFPILKIAKNFLLSQSQVTAAMMCGSGSTMMTILESTKSGEALKKTVLERFGKSVWTWTGQTISTQ